MNSTQNNNEDEIKQFYEDYEWNAFSLDLSKYDNFKKVLKLAQKYDGKLFYFHGSCLNLAFEDTKFSVNQYIDPPSCYRGLKRPVQIIYKLDLTFELSDNNANAYIEDCIMTGVIPKLLPIEKKDNPKKSKKMIIK
jgi:hypothetical protein